MAKPAEVWVSDYLIAIMADEATVRSMTPKSAAIKSIASAAVRGRGNLGVAALASPGTPYDVVSRFFAPGSGIDEDPATGSLHCILSPLFSAKLSRATLRLHQAYPGRGGDLECEAKAERVLLRGGAVTVQEGRLRI